MEKDRLKELRKELELSQEKFGERIGLSKPSISALEKGSRNLTEPHIKLIVNEFNVNEHWLRTGEGEMFEAIPSDELDKLASKYNLNPLAQRIVETFVTLDEKEMNAVLSFVDKISFNIANEESVCKDVVAVDDIETEVEAYRRELEAEKKGKTSSALESIKDIY